MLLSRVVDVLGAAVDCFAEEVQYSVNGKKGVWRTVKGNKIFFPKDGSSAIGMPSAMKTATGKAIMKGIKSRAKQGKPKAKLTGKSAPGGGAGGDSDALASPQKVRETVSEVKDELDQSVGGSGGEALDELEDNGSEEDRESLADLDAGEDIGEGRQRSLASSGVKKAMALGAGAALLSMFPGVLGIGLAFLVGKMAIGAVGRGIARVFEAKSTSRERLALAIEDGIKKAIAKVAKGEVDEKAIVQARKYAEKKRGRS
jgi:hypothetical protein